MTINGATVTDCERRTFADGEAIRYRLPNGVRRVTGEATEWTLPTDAQVWFQPEWMGSIYYEALFTNVTVGAIKVGQRMAFPVTAKLPDGTYRLITEANVVDYTDGCAVYRGNGRFGIDYYADTNGFDQAGAATTPWRVMLVAKDLQTLATSDIVRRLCPAPSAEVAAKCAAFVKPGRAVWQWLPAGDPVYGEQKDWYDRTKALGFEYYLIDDGWKRWRDGAMDQWACLKKWIDYGKSIGVESFMWVDSKEMLTRESRRAYLDKVKASGAVGIKIDFIPTPSYACMKWYEETLADTLARGLMTDFHGCVKPTGRERTWPHEVAREAIRGHEWHITRYARKLPPEHDCILPFNRLVQGHADYTPMVFEKKELNGYTWARELAQAIVFSAPFLCTGDYPKNYLENPAVDLIRTLPSVYDETRILPCSEIGVCIAVAKRKGSTWFIAVENGATARQLDLALDFLGEGAYRFCTYEDRLDRRDDFLMECRLARKSERLKIDLQPCGGFVGVAVASDSAEYLKNYREVDTDRAMARLERLWRCEVRQTMSGKRKAAETVLEYLRQDGFSQIEAIELPTDGKTSCQDKHMPFAWEAKVGRLTIINEGDFVGGRCIWSGKGKPSPVVADYDVHPFHLVKGSTAVPPGGLTVRALSEAQFLAGEDAKGAIVILGPETWPRARMLTPLLDRGALGFVCDQLVGGFETPDRIQWVTACTETASWSPDNETRPFVGFSVSPRTGQRLRALASAGGLVLKVECDGQRVATTMPFVTAVVPGRKPQEVWVLSHMYEPLASDDSNGVVASIETARRFIGREKPEYTIRVLFGIEYYGYAAYIDHVGCPLRDRVVGAINLDSIPCQRGSFLNLRLGGPATPFCGNLIYESLAESLKGLPEMLDWKIARYGEYFDDYFIADPMVGVPMVGALHINREVTFWHNSIQDMALMEASIYRRSLAFAATYVDRLANPSAKLIPACAALAEKRILRAKDEAKSLEHFDHLASVERRQLADFDRVIGAGAATSALAAFDAKVAALRREVKAGALADSPWRRYAAGIVPARKAVGLPQDQTRVPRELRQKTPGDITYCPLVNAVANMDGQKDLARLLREAEYESGTVLTEDEIADYVRTVCFLADWDYLSLTNARELKSADVIQSLAAAGVKKGDLILVDADLDSVGHIVGGMDAVLAALSEAVGPEGTVLMPSFTPSVRLCGAVNRSWDYRPYDAKDIASIAKSNPITAAFLRKNPKAVRSAHLVRSWTGFGPRAADCLAAEKPDAIPYADDSPIAKALARGGKFVRIGSGPVAAEYARYLAFRAGKVASAPAVVGVRQRDGSSADVIVPKYPVACASVALPTGIATRQAALGLSSVTVVSP